MAFLKNIRKAVLCAPVFALLFLCASPHVSYALSDAQTLEFKIKAGLVYNFLKYTNWDIDANSEKKSINLCTIGDSPLNTYLYQMHGRTAQQYTINVLELKQATSASECNFVYIHRSHAGEAAGIVEAFNAYPVITMSDADDFIETGGMVELSVQQDKKIHIYINKAALNKSGMSIQPRLMKLAEKASP